MTDDEIRALVRAKLADGTLPWEPPIIATDIGMLGQQTRMLRQGGNSQDETCSICGGQPTQTRYGTPGDPGGPIAFHDRRHAIWLEEIGKRRG